ncbi:MAG: hypothetical protein HPZ79_07530 [Oscillospiraceae bacterium]|nr:hypothetical protein [Oscillospiraceae bacterium]
MSHSLHRSGSSESLRSDFPVLAIGARGFNRDGCADSLVKIGEIFLKHNPVNSGILGLDGAFTADRANEARQTITDGAVTHAVFSSEADLVACLKELQEADLGVSIIVSGLFDTVHECCHEAGLEPHTVNCSLGVWGNVEEKMPEDSRIADVTTMCGHGMIPFTLVESMVEKVKKGLLTPAQAAEKISPQCHCHIFNTERAARILEEIAQD